MKTWPAAVLAASVIVLAGCTGKDAVSQGNNNAFRFVSGTSKGHLIAADQRKTANPFTGDLLSGGTYSSSADAGKVTVVNFWATWCGPCTAETPDFDGVYRAYKSQGVQFVGIDTKDSPASRPKSFVKDNDISFPIIYDEEGETAVRLGHIPLGGLPATVILDRHGKVAAVYAVPLTAADLDPVLTKLVAEG